MNPPVTALGTGNVEPTNEAIEIGAPSNAGVSTQEMCDALQSSSDEEPDEMCEERVGATTADAATIAAPRAPADQEDRRRPVAIVHYFEWCRASSTELPLNGVVPPCQWSVRNVIGEVMFPGATNSAAINDMSALDFSFSCSLQSSSSLSWSI